LDDIVDEWPTSEAGTVVVSDKTQSLTAEEQAILDQIEKDARAEDAQLQADLEKALELLEKEAEEAINKNDSIKDKAVALKEIKEYIGRADILKLVEEGQATPEQVLEELLDTVEAEGHDDVITPQDALSYNQLPADVKETVAKQNEIDNSKSDVKKVEEKIADLNDRIANLEAKADAIEGDFDQRAVEIEKLKSDLEVAKSSDVEDYIVEGLQSTLEKAIKDFQTDYTKAEAIASELESVKEELEEAKQELLQAKAAEAIKAQESAIKKLEDDIKTAEESDAEPYIVEGLRKELEQLKTHAVGFNPLDAAVAEELPEFNGGVNGSDATVA
ncbi:hypothetical protein, partial [Streptococcus oralis]|uniref:hypothetical protein n=1 Tax=Streptococcus oralis TaxID=1303 RepID=UPI0013E92362